MAWFRWPKGGEGGTAPAAVPAEISHRQFTAEHAAVLNLLYWETDCPLDSLPYTEAFEGLYGHFLLKTGVAASRHSVWRALVGYRKAGRLRRPDANTGGGE